MGVLNALKARLQETLKEYIDFNLEAKQLILKKKAVLLLCQKAICSVEQLEDLEPDVEEGLIATIKHKDIQIKVQFTPKKMILNKDSIEGEIYLLTPLQFQTESLIYRTLIAGWSIFLGGKIPDKALPEGVRIVDKNKLYYTIPRQKLKLLDSLFSGVKEGSALMMNLKQGELKIQSSVDLKLNDIKFQDLLQLLNSNLK